MPKHRKSGKKQIDQYDHKEAKRTNNPLVGLVTPWGPQMTPHIKEIKTRITHTETPRQLLEAKLHEAIRLAREQIAVREGAE